MKISFDHEKLEVHQQAIAFCAWTGDLGLLKRFSGRAEFLREDDPNYNVRIDQDQEQDQEQDGGRT